MHLWGDGMSLGLVYKNGEHIFDEVCGEVPFLTYPLFEKTGVVKSAFSTRIGGVSKGCYESMNLSFDRGDDKDAVMENFQRIASAIGTNCHDMVLSRQTHTANVRVVTEEDKGKGIVRERDYTDVDGLVTNVPGSCPKRCCIPVPGGLQAVSHCQQRAKKHIGCGIIFQLHAKSPSEFI